MSDAQTDMEKATEMAENAAGIGARIGDEFEDTSRPTKAQLEAWLRDATRAATQMNTSFLAVRAIARNARVSELASQVAESEAKESRFQVCRKYESIIAGVQALINCVLAPTDQHTFPVPLFDNPDLDARADKAVEALARRRMEDRVNEGRLEEARLAHEVSVAVVGSAAINAGRMSYSHGGSE